MASILVIYNPVAGRGRRVRKEWPAVEAALLKSGIDFDAVPTSAPLEAVTLAREGAGKYKAVVGVGGDGTIHEIVNGLLQASGERETIPLGVVPLGNGDDFAKMLPPEAPVGGKPFEWQVAISKVVEGKTRLFDAVRMLGDNGMSEAEGTPHYFANAMDVGFGAHTVLNFATIPKVLKGMPSYMAAVLKTLINYTSLRLRIQLDDQPPFEQATTITAITNGRCFGGSFWVCPDAEADDGVLDVMVGEAVGRFTILRLIPKFLNGTHMNEPEIKMYCAQRVTLESESPLVVEADGEIPYTETHRLEIDILPKKLCVFV
ncbi:MAG: diacylglycerol kinase family protein [Pseudomonadota bacterium]